jgi:uncharacterized protein (DUF1499 family)
MSMTILKWLLIALVALVVLGVLAGQLGLLKGTAPSTLGVREGKLKPPSQRPNSVSSQAALYPDHPRRAYAQIEPLALKGDAAATLARIKGIVQDMPGAQVVRSEGEYLYAQFTTPLMKFVDDVEFWADAKAGVVHVRSASRVGHGDRGVNRARVEAIRAKLAAAG